MHRSGIAFAAGISVLVTACQKPAPPTDTSARKAGDPAAEASRVDLPARDGREAEASAITMRYHCTQGHRVAIVHGDIARVTLADGRVVDIGRVPDSAPPRYSGEALSFDVGNDGAVLGQHETGGFACREAD